MIYKCKNCGYSFYAKRARCVKCGSTSFDEINASEGELLAYWKLNATPDGFEDTYWLCLLKVGDSKIFCRSLKEPRNKMLIKDNGICEP
ncbi:MAG: zinc ribbon domain-containing protein [Saccharolobus sp.]